MTFDETRLGRSGQVAVKAAAEDRGAVMAYLTLGFPDVPTSIAAMLAVIDEGVDAIEIGLPYTDPILDGPAIQRAGTAALDRGVRTRDVLTAVEAVAGAGVPAMVMTYWNLVERYGVEPFARDIAAAGGAGLITPDLTPDEGADFLAKIFPQNMTSWFPPPSRSLARESSLPLQLNNMAGAPPVGKW